MTLAHRLVATLGLGLLLTAAGCDKKAEPAPARVQAPQEAAPAAAEEPTAADGPTLAAVDAPVDEAEAKAAVAGGSEADCPFDEHHAAGEEEAAGGCQHGAAPSEAAVEGGRLHLGAPFSLTEAKPLAAVLTAAPEGSADAVQFTGTIDKVCKAKGCWMVVKDGDVQARIMMKGHAFSVPQDSLGKATTVEGTLSVKTFSEAQVKHLAQDGGEDPEAVSGEKKEYVVTATAVAIGS